MKLMSKKIAIFLVLATLLSLCACAGEKTNGEIVGDLVYYPQTDGTYGVGAYEKSVETLTTVTVPAQYNGKNVTVVVANGFANCTALKQITLPETIREIQDFSFSNCTRLADLTLNEGLLTIGSYAFSGCKKLKEISLPDSVVTLEEHAFSFCSRLETVKLSNGMNALEAYTFYKCDALKEIDVPDCIYTVAPYAFEDCDALLEVKLGSRLVSFNESIVKGCRALEKITMSEENTLYYSVDGVLYNELTDEIVFVPKNLSGDITVPQGVTKIAASTFANRVGLTSVTLAASVEYVGSSAFFGCDSIEKIVVEGILDNWYFGDGYRVKESILSDPETAAIYFLDKTQVTATYRSTYKGN